MTGHTRGRERPGVHVVEADAVVVGTGAGGSVAARALAEAGARVACLEEGGWHEPEDFTQREDEMFPLLFQDAGGRTTEDMAIRVLQGRGVGGSTVHNTNLCKRTPDPILELWARRHGVEGASPAALRGAFERIERELSIAPVDESMINANNDVLRRGARALGWAHGVLQHNRVGCRGSGFCELGCAYDAKQNARKVVVPRALELGAMLWSDARADRVEHDGRRASGVRATLLDASGRAHGRLHVRAPVVVLAASATASAALALRSALPDPYGRIGAGLRLHPGAVVAGEFDDEIAGHRGIPQSIECTEHLSYEEGSERRTWIVPAFAHPIGTASTLPGFGRDHMAAMRAYRRMAVLTAMLHDESEGRVLADPDGAPVLRYSMNGGDRRGLARGVLACARLLLAAGARRVTIPALEPRVVRSMTELDRLDMSFVEPHSVPLSAVHPMGTMAMGSDPRRSVVRSTGEHHFVRDLFVSDGSLFPTSLGGPPQLSIYAFAQHLSAHFVAAARAH